MSNPWLKKNPFLSMWLSSANRVAGMARSRASAEVKRQATTAGTNATRDLFRLWTDALTPAPISKKPRKRH